MIGEIEIPEFFPNPGTFALRPADLARPNEFSVSDFVTVLSLDGGYLLV
jgi:hypothetical protein